MRHRRLVDGIDLVYRSGSRGRDGYIADMRFRLSTAAVALALGALPVAAHAASCDAPGRCELVHSDGRWTAVDDRNRMIDLREPPSETSVVVMDGTRDRSDAVVDGSRSDAVNRIVDSVMWTRSSDGRDEVWTRASHAMAHTNGRRATP